MAFLVGGLRGDALRHAADMRNKRGGTISDSMRLQTRRNGVRAVRRAVDAVDAVDRLFAHAGGGALHRDRPMQRFWRDLHAGMNHVCNVADPMYQAYGLELFGFEPDPFGW